MSPAADPRAACIIGVARRTWHPDDFVVVANDGLAPEPLDMWERVVRDAAADAGGRVAGALGELEGVDVVYSQSWQYDDAVQRLSDRLGASPARRRYSGIGGSVPHVLAVEAARAIRAGDLDFSLLVGAEALATVRRLKKAGERPAWSFRPDGEAPVPDGHAVRPLGDQPLRLRGLPDVRAVRQRTAGASRAVGWPSTVPRSGGSWRR